MPESLSTSRVAVIHMAPKIGSALPLTLSAMAPAPSTRCRTSFGLRLVEDDRADSAPTEMGICRGQL